MILAQMPNASVDQVNAFIWGLFGIVGILSVTFVGLAAAKAFFAKKSSGDQYVSKGELKELEDSMDSDLGKMATTLKGVQEKVDLCATKIEVKELAEQLRNSVHRLRDDLQPVAMAVAVVQKLQEGQEKQITALTLKVDGSHDLLLEIRGFVRKNGQPEKQSA